MDEKSPLDTTAAFDWADPFRIEDQLTADERLIRDTAERFAQEKLRPLVRENFRNESFDRSIFRQAGALGFLAATLPEEVGGASLNAVSYGLIARAFEAVDSGFRSALGVQHTLVTYPIFAYGTPEQRQRFIPALARGEKIGCFALTEAEAGSDPGGLTTRAVPCDDGFILNGAKIWITNAPLADLMIVWARLPDGPVRGFIVEREFAGVTTPEITGKFSLRASPTGEVILKDCHVPERNVLPGAVGFASVFDCLNKARFSIVWGAMGAAESCWNIARDYVLERRQFGRPLAANQLVQKKLADMQTEIALGLQGALRLGRMLEDGGAAHELISLLKRNNCAKALEIARNARDMLGANGIVDDYDVIRHMLNLETVNTYEGAADIHALVLGRAMTGLAAF